MNINNDFNEFKIEPQTPQSVSLKNLSEGFFKEPLLQGFLKEPF